MRAKTFEAGQNMMLSIEIVRFSKDGTTLFQAFNVLRYEIGQKYDAHYDAFNPAEYGPQTSQRVQ
jgi:prolyl 4-hydroxylase